MLYNESNNLRIYSHRALIPKSMRFFGRKFVVASEFDSNNVTFQLLASILQNWRWSYMIFLLAILLIDLNWNCQQATLPWSQLLKMMIWMIWYANLMQAHERRLAGQTVKLVLIGSENFLLKRIIFMLKLNGSKMLASKFKSSR